MIGAILMAGAVTVLIVTTLGRQRHGNRSRPEHTPADAMSITAAYGEATRLANAKQFLASLPYYRRVGALLPQPAREFELLIAGALSEGALESRPDALQPATRSSVERVAVLAEALAHLERARSLSRTAREAAEVEVKRAHLLHIWGFPWEALGGLRAAVAADPSWTEMAQTADFYTYYLHHPGEKIAGVDFDAALEPPAPAPKLP